MKALAEYMRGTHPTAPVRGIELIKRAAWIERYHWTFDQYDNAKAGDILFQAEFDYLLDLQRKAQLKATDG